MYSVFEIRVRVACKIPKLVAFTRVGAWIDFSQSPSPKPSIKIDPASLETFKIKVSESFSSELY